MGRKPRALKINANWTVEIGDDGAPQLRSIYSCISLAFTTATLRKLHAWLGEVIAWRSTRRQMEKPRPEEHLRVANGHE